MVIIFLLSIELIQRGLVYDWIITIEYDFIDKLCFVVHLFDSLWVTPVLVCYLIAVLTIYDSSPMIRTLLNILAIPAWFVLFVFLSQFLPVYCRVVAVILSIILTVVGFTVDLRERINQNVMQSNPDSTDKTNEHGAFFTDTVNVFNQIRAYYNTRSENSSQPVTSTSSASSTPYFTFLLWLLIAIKVYQFQWYFIRLLIFVITYQIIKRSLIKIYNYLIRQESIQLIVKRIIEFLQVR